MNSYTIFKDLLRASVEDLRRALASGDPIVRMAAVDAVVKKGDLSGLSSLEVLTYMLLKDRDKNIRFNAFFYLRSIGGNEIAIVALSRVLRDDESGDVRAWAAKLFGEIGDPRAIEPLAKALRDDKSGDVRIASAKALGKIGDPRAIEPLAKALRDDESDWARRCAAKALGKIGDPRAIELLTKTLRDDESGDVRIASAEALDKLKWKPATGYQEGLYLKAKQQWHQVPLFRRFMWFLRYGLRDRLSGRL